MHMRKRNFTGYFWLLLHKPSFIASEECRLWYKLWGWSDSLFSKGKLHVLSDLNSLMVKVYCWHWSQALEKYRYSLPHRAPPLSRRTISHRQRPPPRLCHLIQSLATPIVRQSWLSCHQSSQGLLLSHWGGQQGQILEKGQTDSIFRF